MVLLKRFQSAGMYMLEYALSYSKYLLRTSGMIELSSLTLPLNSCLTPKQPFLFKSCFGGNLLLGKGVPVGKKTCVNLLPMEGVRGQSCFPALNTSMPTIPILASCFYRQHIQYCFFFICCHSSRKQYVYVLVCIQSTCIYLIYFSWTSLSVGDPPQIPNPWIPKSMGDFIEVFWM